MNSRGWENLLGEQTLPIGQIKALIGDLRAAEERAEKAVKEAIDANYAVDKARAERDHLCEKVKALETVQEKIIDGAMEDLNNQILSLRKELEDYKAYYETAKAHWTPTHPCDEAIHFIIAHIESRRQQQITPPTMTLVQPAIKFCSECGTPLGIDDSLARETAQQPPADFATRTEPTAPRSDPFHQATHTQQTEAITHDGLAPKVQYIDPMDGTRRTDAEGNRLFGRQQHGKTK